MPQRAKTSDVSKEWDAQAATFDNEPDHGLVDEFVRGAWRAVLAPLLPAREARIADVGCGTGSLCVLLAGDGHHVTGFDVSPKMLVIARKKFDVAGVSVPLVCADAATLPLKPSSFDVVLVRHVLWAMPDTRGALKHWTSLLRDGRLILIEGRWSTGAGISAGELVDALHSLGAHTTVTPLVDPQLWGKVIDDDRYLVVATPAAG